MELRARLVRWSLRRPHVLVVDAPGATELRWSAEAELDRRGWPTVGAPADTDLLLVLGSPGPGLTEAVDVLWSQVPYPRWRAQIEDRTALGEHLDDAAAALTDSGKQRSAAADAPPSPWPAPRPDSPVSSPHEPHDGGDQHDHMDHGGEVAGLAMAGAGADRDGLELDALTVHLGPVLPGWPTGLVVRASMQGDVLTGVSAFGLDPYGSLVHGTGAEEDQPAVRALDGLLRFLLVAGWPSHATTVRRLRDRLLGHGVPLTQSDRHRASRVVQQIGTSRTLAWSVRGIGRVPVTDGMPVPLAGDALDRVRRWCDIAGTVLAGTRSPQCFEVRLPAGRLPALLEGAELAAARLIVASFDIDVAAVGTRDNADDGGVDHEAAHRA